MAGHSKWANIKRQKARVDAQKGKTFARLSRAIIVAARQGVPDPEGNFQLRSAITKAKAAGIPNDNIERAIAKGAGTLEAGNEWEEIRYEGYGAGGVAILIEALSDNRNRTAGDLRGTFSKYDGNLGETGCVGWMFHQKGVITLSGEIDEEAFLEVVLDSGAESYEFVEDAEAPLVEVHTEVTNLETLAQQLKDQGYDVTEVESRWIAENSVEISDPDVGQKLLKLLDALEELDDVQEVTTNLVLSEELENLVGV